jgi:hypothetical protein
VVSPRILVTVSRTWTDISTMREVLAQVYERHPTAVLVHGDCPKGDRLAARLWKKLGGQEEKWPAAWGTKCTATCDHKPRFRKDRTEYCPVPGPSRNARMVESNPDLVLAFVRNNSSGAMGTYNLAKGAGLNVVDPYIQED